jgi:hypothetical protein
MIDKKENKRKKNENLQLLHCFGSISKERKIKRK